VETKPLLQIGSRRRLSLPERSAVAATAASRLRRASGRRRLGSNRC